MIANGVKQWLRRASDDVILRSDRLHGPEEIVRNASEPGFAGSVKVYWLMAPLSPAFRKYLMVWRSVSSTLLHYLGLLQQRVKRTVFEQHFEAAGMLITQLRAPQAAVLAQL